MSHKQISRTCVECGQRFTVKSPKAIFCSFKCSSSHMRREKILKEFHAHRQEYEATAAKTLPHTQPTQWTTGQTPEGEHVDVQVGHEALLLYGKTCTCPQCGRAFRTPLRKNTKFCSSECWHASRHKQTTNTCLTCGKTFTCNQDDVNFAKGQYCSEDCERAFYDNVRKDLVAVSPHVDWRKCVNCGHVFLDEQAGSVLFCSSTCKHEFHQKQRLQTYTCAACGKTFTSIQANPRYCSVACGSRHMHKLHPEYAKTMHTGAVWNKGLTAATNPVIANNGLRRTLAMMHGQRVHEYVDIAGNRHVMAVNSGDAQLREVSPYSHISGVFNDIGHYVRSGWEYNFAKILQYLGREYRYEPTTFELSDGLYYTPDFFIPARNVYYEIKGWFTQEHKETLQQFAIDYPHVHLVLLDKPRYERVYKWFRHHSRLRLIASFNDKPGDNGCLSWNEIDTLRGWIKNGAN